MLLYTDIVSGDEMLTDAFPIKVIDDIVYEVNCEMIAVGGDNVDIGANPSAEEAEESLEDTAAKVNNIVHSGRLQATTFDKKTYMVHIRDYMKAVKAHLKETNPDRVQTFEKNATTFVKKIIGNIKDYEFYTGESMNPDGMVALLNYREDGITPYLTFWKDGFKEVKL